MRQQEIRWRPDSFGASPTRVATWALGLTIPQSLLQRADEVIR